MSWDSNTIEFRVKELERELQDFREVTQTNQSAVDVDTNSGFDGKGFGSTSNVLGPINYPFIYNPVFHRRFDTEPPPEGGSNEFNTIHVRATTIVIEPKEISISNISGTGTVTVVTAIDHQLSTSDVVDIINTTNFDVTGVTITVSNPTTFTYSDAGNGTAETRGSVVETISPIQIRTLADAIHNGQLLYITVRDGRTLDLLKPTTEGNIDLDDDILGKTERDLLCFQWHVNNPIGTSASGSWIEVSGGSGSSGTSVGLLLEPVLVTNPDGANAILASQVEDGDVIDGTLIQTGDRVLLRDQTDASENGIYVVKASGAPDRAPDFDSVSNIIDTTLVPVRQGDTNEDKFYQLTNDEDPIVVETTDLVFIEHGASGWTDSSTNTSTGTKTFENTRFALRNQADTFSGLFTFGSAGNIVWTLPATSTSIAGLNIANTWTQAQTFNQNVLIEKNSPVLTLLDSFGGNSLSIAKLDTVTEYNDNVSHDFQVATTSKMVVSSTQVNIKVGTVLGAGTGDTIIFQGFTQGNIRPIVADDDTWDLGGVGQEWRNLYIDRTAFIDSLDVGEVITNLLVSKGSPLFSLLDTGSGNSFSIAKLASVTDYNDNVAHNFDIANVSKMTISSTQVNMKTGTVLGAGTGDTIIVQGFMQGNLRPIVADDDTWDLGGVGQEWRNLYVDGTAFIDTAQIATISLVDQLAFTGAGSSINGINLINLVGSASILNIQQGQIIAVDTLTFNGTGSAITNLEDITLLDANSLINMNGGHIDSIDHLDFNSSGSFIQQIDTITMLDLGSVLNMNQGSITNCDDIDFNSVGSFITQLDFLTMLDSGSLVNMNGGDVINVNRLQFDTGTYIDMTANNITLQGDTFEKIVIDANGILLDCNSTVDDITLSSGDDIILKVGSTGSLIVLGHDFTANRIWYERDTDDLKPTDSISNLGGTSNRWSTIYADNVLNVSFTKFKQDIVELDDGNCMGVCDALKTIEYAWKPDRFSEMKEPKRTNLLARKFVGFNADALKTMLPNATEDDMIYPNAVIGVLLGAVRHLKARIEQLEQP